MVDFKGTLGLAVVAVLATAVSVTYAQTGDAGLYRLEADRNTPLDFGDSWKRSSLSPAGASCVEIDLSKARQLEDGGFKDNTFKMVTSNQEIAEDMSISVDAKFSAVTPAAVKIKAHASVDFMNKFTTNCIRILRV